MKTLEQLIEQGVFDDRDEPSYTPIHSKRKQQFHPPSALETLDRQAHDYFVARARERIIDAFVHRTDRHRGKAKVSDCIRGIGPRQRDLARYIARFCEAHPFVEIAHLTADNLRQLPTGKQRLVIEAWQHELITEALQPLCTQGHIWFNSHDGGTWELKQHLKDKRPLQRKLLYTPQEGSAA